MGDFAIPSIQVTCASAAPLPTRRQTAQSQSMLFIKLADSFGCLARGLIRLM